MMLLLPEDWYARTSSTADLLTVNTPYPVLPLKSVFPNFRMNPLR